MRISSSLLCLSLTILCLGTANAYLWHTRNPAVAALARIASFPRVDPSARAMGFRDPFEDIFDELDADDSHQPQHYHDLFAQFDPLQTVRRMQEQHHKLEHRHRKFLDELEARLKLTDALPPLHTESSMPAAPSAATTSRAGGIIEVTSNADSEHTAPQPASSSASSSAESSESQSASQVSASSSSSDGLLSQVLRAPKIQVSEKDDLFSLSAEIPGVRKEDLKIEVKEDDFGTRLLFISGERKQEESSSDKERGTASSRSVYGQFSRTLSLPRDAKTDQITAGYENGVLKINVPREQPKVVTKSVQIQ